MSVGVTHMTVDATATPAPGPTVGADFAKGLLEFAVASGADRQTLMARANLTDEHFAEPGSRIPAASYVALMMAGKELSGDPALALHYGQKVEISKVSVAGAASRLADTFEQGIVQLNRYVRLIIEADAQGRGERFVIETQDDGVWFIDNRLNANTFPELTESAFAQFCCHSGRSEHPNGTKLVRAAHVTHSKPHYWPEYERVLGIPVVFESRHNALLIDPAWRSYKFKGPDPEVREMLRDHADRQLAQLDQSQSEARRVQAALLPSLHQGEASAEQIAHALGVSRKTLYRRLKAEGTTYADVLEDLRARLSRHYLHERRMSVNEAAYMLGFSDASAFSRAHMRWTGQRPGQLRTSGMRS